MLPEYMREYTSSIGVRCTPPDARGSYIGYYKGFFMMIRFSVEPVESNSISRCKTS
jgi:hypothetical protein